MTENPTPKWRISGRVLGPGNFYEITIVNRLVLPIKVENVNTHTHPNFFDNGYSLNNFQKTVAKNL